MNEAFGIEFLLSEHDFELEVNHQRTVAFGECIQNSNLHGLFRLLNQYSYTGQTFLLLAEIEKMSEQIFSEDFVDDNSHKLFKLYPGEKDLDIVITFWMSDLVDRINRVLSRIPIPYQEKILNNSRLISVLDQFDLEVDPNFYKK